MKTRPEGGPRPAAALIAAATLCFACGVSLKETAAKHPLSERASAFLSARSQPASVAASAVTAHETVDVGGAVERPGQLVIGPYAQTLRQALDAMGGLSPTATLLRIRPGDDELAKLFAQVDGADSAIEIPLSALAAVPTVYLRPGDVIEVAAAEIPSLPPTPSNEASRVILPPVAALPVDEVAKAEELKAPEPMDAVKPEPPKAQLEGGAPIAVVEEEKIVEPANAGSTPDGELRAELAALRGDLYAKLRVLRADVERLQEENVKLRARLDLTTRPSPAFASAPARKPIPLAERVDSHSAVTVEARTASMDKPEQKSARDAQGAEAGRVATVLVSGSVKNPGMYPIEMVKTVGGAVRAAGNRTDANLQAIVVRADGQRGALIGMGLGLGAAPSKTVVDLVAVDAGKSRDVSLRGGEVIFVPSSQRSERAQ